MLKHAIYPIISQYISHATLVEGTLKGGAVPCRCILIMVPNSPLENYLLLKMFGETFTRVRTWRIWIPSLKRLVKKPPTDVDFCIANLLARWDRSFNTMADLKIPSIVHQVIDLTGDWPDIKKRFHRKKREIFNRFMKSNPYTYKISKDLADFDYFYYRMYEPHSKKHFQDCARIDSYDEMKKYFLKGFLLILMEDDNAVAGSLCLVKRDTMIYHRGGVLDGDEEHIRKGAQTALYYYKILIAKDQKLSRLDLLQSRPFFNDGVYRHKREWGASVSVDEDLETWMYFFNLRNPEQAASFFQINPVIVSTPEGLMGYCVSAESTGVDDVDTQDLARHYYASGLKGILLQSPGSKSPSRFAF
jgi:hypothetical protein